MFSGVDILLGSRTLGATETVLEGRKHTENILHSRDDRLLVVVGCALRIRDST